MTHDEAVAHAHTLSDEELRVAAQGCTELTCPYHGAVNTVRRERGIR